MNVERSYFYENYVEYLGTTWYEEVCKEIFDKWLGQDNCESEEKL